MFSKEALGDSSGKILKVPIVVDAVKDLKIRDVACEKEFHYNNCISVYVKCNYWIYRKEEKSYKNSYLKNF